VGHLAGTIEKIRHLLGIGATGYISFAEELLQESLPIKPWNYFLKREVCGGFYGSHFKIPTAIPRFHRTPP